MTEVSQNTPLNVSAEKLSIIDKYFSLKKEWRINRMQFFVRNIIGIVMWFCIMFCIGIIVIISPFFLDRWSMGLFSVILIPIFTVTIIVPLYVFCISTCKRAHDLNHSGAWYCLWYFLWPWVIGFILGILSGIILISVGIEHLSGVYTTMYIFGCLLLLMIPGILQFRKWNPGYNQYGPAPTGKPLV